MRTARVFTLVLWMLAWSHSAAASTRLAVFIFADDAQLSSNLTEVAIASLARKGGYELLGLNELEGRLSQLSTVKTDGLRACFAEAACLSELGATASVEEVVIGDVRRDTDQFGLELALVDTKTGIAKARLPGQTPADLPALIAAVQSGVLELTREPKAAAVEPLPPPPPPPPARVEPPPPPKTTQPPAERPRRDEPRRSDSVVPYVAYGTAALAVVAFSAAAVTGTLGTARPEGDSRAEVQADIERHKDYTALANGLYVTGGILAGVSVVGFILPWD